MKTIERKIPNLEKPAMTTTTMLGYNKNENSKIIRVDDNEIKAGGKVFHQKVNVRDVPEWTPVEPTLENYLAKVEAFERRCEERLIKLLAELDIKAMVKTDPYSLIHNGECSVTLQGESYMNGPFEFHRVMREIIKQILNKNLHKLRFYMFINCKDDNAKGPLGFLHNAFGSVEYKFRYHYNTTELC